MLKNEDIVCITAYIDLHNIYVRKFESYVELQNLIESVQTYCTQQGITFSWEIILLINIMFIYL